jgi:hypothetical protein
VANANWSVSYAAYLAQTKGKNAAIIFAREKREDLTDEQKVHGAC